MGWVSSRRCHLPLVQGSGSRRVQAPRANLSTGRCRRYDNNNHTPARGCDCHQHNECCAGSDRCEPSSAGRRAVLRLPRFAYGVSPQHHGVSWRFGSVWAGGGHHSDRVAANRADGGTTLRHKDIFRLRPPPTPPRLCLSPAPCTCTMHSAGRLIGAASWWMGLMLGEILTLA